MFGEDFLLYCLFIFSLLELTQWIKAFKGYKKVHESWIYTAYSSSSGQLLLLLALWPSTALPQGKLWNWQRSPAGKLGFTRETQIWRVLVLSISDNSVLSLEFCLFRAFSPRRNTCNKYCCNTTHRTPTLLQIYKESSSLLWGAHDL